MPVSDYPTASQVHTTFVHPEHQYWHTHWQNLRDANIGEVEIKRKNTQYLPKLDGMTPAEYAAFLDRSVYFNMTARTLVGLMGSLFRRNPVIEGLPKEKFDLNDVTKESQPLNTFVQQIAREVFLMGRYGVLIDMDENGKRPPYFAGYVTENIVDWATEEIDGRWLVTEVIVRELRLARPIINPISVTPPGKKQPKQTSKQLADGAQVFSNDTTVTRAARRWIASYRVLRLEHEDPADETSPRIYRQYYHTSDRGDASPEGAPFAVYTPTWRGKPFPFIPFVFFGPYDTTPDVEKSPMLDIVRLNLSHYRSYSMLEHGRFFTALPVYYCPVNNGEERGQYTIGPSVVWETQGNERPGIIEFNGSGLRYLENALKDKEAQIASLGGRMLDPSKVSAGESNNQVKVKEQNENALLLSVSQTIDVGITKLLQWWAEWQDVSPQDALGISFETNKDFLLSSTGAREFRAIQMMYEAGIIPIEVVYDYMRRAEVVPDWMAIDQFKKLLENKNSFPNNPDVQAMQDGAPNAQSLWDAEHVLVDPQVVAVRGYDSQAPAGQEPLPGQTAGGPVTADATAPTGVRPADVKLQASLELEKQKEAGKTAVKVAQHTPKPAVPTVGPKKPAQPKK